MSPEDAQAEVLVFDTGPLSHFARQNWLGVLKAVAGERTVMIPEAVVEELRRGALLDSRLQLVLDADWIERRAIDVGDLPILAKYTSRLVVGDRNLGEASVLALAEVLPGTAVVDDGAARKAAKQNGVALRPTLRLLCDAVRDQLLTAELVSHLADDLIADSYRLPFKRGQFIDWARSPGLLG